MAKSSKGRRAIAEQLRLTEEEEKAAGRGGRSASSRGRQGNALDDAGDDVNAYLGRAGAGGARTAPQRKAAPRKSSRKKLPSDSAIAGAMIKRLFRWVLNLAIFFFVSSIALVVIYRFVDPPVTPLMLIRPLEGMASGKVVGVSKQWVDIDDVNPALLRSVIAAEDSRFFGHGGVDWDAVKKAEERNKRSDGKKLYGASTITMQCARNVFLWQGRNYLRKGLEVYFTYLMELLWSKKRILEVYVNVIEWGDGIYGVEAASQAYFNIPAAKLSSTQASLLAAVLPNPREWNPASPTAYIKRRSASIRGGAPSVNLGPLAERSKKGEE